MIELEYRLSLKCADYGRFLETLIKRFQISDVKTYAIYYIKPHFRFKLDTLEIKHSISNTALYHDKLWFKFCASEEIPFKKWSKHASLKFLENAGQFSNPFAVEYRTELSFEKKKNLKVYGFRKNNLSGVMFELELKSRPNEDAPVTKEDVQAIVHETRHRLHRYRDVYLYFRKKFSIFPYAFLKDVSRKTVIPIHLSKLLERLNAEPHFLVAPKHDGIFGFVYSFADEIREVWEDNQFRLFRGRSLGDGFVFGAEKMSDDSVVLLDVYQVRGSPVACTENLLLKFLPRLAHRYPRYRAQSYFRPADLTACPFSSYCDRLLSGAKRGGGEENGGLDGLVFHDTKKDEIYKLKSRQTLDLVHFDGHFLFPNNEKKKIAREYLPLKNGVVYECALRPSLRPLRERVDRFVGNSKKQMDDILACL